MRSDPGPAGGASHDRRVIVRSLGELERLRASDLAALAIGLAADPIEGRALEAAGADFIVRDATEAEELRTLVRRPETLSLVLLAYEEEASVARAIQDARRFGALAFEGYEVVVVDDGSADGTAAAIAAEAERGDVVVVTHPRNRGMGAALASGFAAARGDFVAPFPADRQVRPQALAPFLSLLTADRMVVGFYETPHTGGVRALLSWGFRANLRYVGGLHVRFDGTYCFPRAWLDRIDQRRLGAASFVYSYELLEALRCVGCRLVHRPVRPFLREAGQSKVANLRRIGRVFRETAESRLRSLRARSPVGGSHGR